MKCYNCGGNHYRRDCPKETQESRDSRGPKPPEVAVVTEKKVRKPKNGGKKLSSGSGDTNHAIEEVRSVSEEIDEFRTHVDRIHNTMELSDYFRKGRKKVKSQGIYDVGKPVELNRKGLKKSTESGLGTLLDKLHSINPEFVQVAELTDLEIDQFIQREHQRPPGYSATTRAHAGRLCLPVLNDSGATCSCITEEALCLLINHTT